jgi:GTP-binding protein
LLNTFREKLPFRDIPIKLYMRSRKQTDPAERSSSSARSGRDDELLDLTPGGPRADLPDQNLQRGHLDFGTRYLNREVNELLSELDS